MAKKKTKTKKPVRSRIDGKPRKKNRGRNPVITEEDTLNLEKCFRFDYTVLQALAETKIDDSTFYVKMKNDPIFKRRMVAAKKSAFTAIKTNVIVKAEKDPYLGVRVLERREKKDWSTGVTHDMKVAPVRVIFQGGPTQFFDKKEIAKQKAAEEEVIPTDADFFE